MAVKIRMSFFAFILRFGNPFKGILTIFVFCECGNRLFRE